MGVVDLINTKHAAKVDTFIQAKFHLNNGEVLVHPVNWLKSIFIEKQGEDEIKLVVMNRAGVSSVFEGDFKALQNMMEEYSFYVFQGFKLEEVETPSTLQRIAGTITNLFNRGG